MAAEPRRVRARRAAGLVVALALALLLAPVLAAPGVPATCDKVLELVARAGESVGDEEREACEQHYGRLRASRGVFGWAWLSWCTRAARSVPQAGQC